jgi:uncharacterized protein YbaA (DUF1428 family)
MGCMGTTTLREKHKGTSTFGGRYASHDRTESSVSLRPDLAEATSEEPLNGAEALSVARVLARHALRRSKLGSHLVDDIAQDSLTSVINSRTRGTVGALTPGLIANATRQAVSHHLSTINGVRHEEFKARQKLDGQVDDLSQELGRGLTDAEIDVMAERIRDTWHDPRHKPAVGFQKKFTEVDLDGEGSEAYDMVAPQFRSAGGERSHRLADDIESGAVDKTQARRGAWNAIAGDLGLPEVTAGSITESRARKYVAVIGDRVNGALDVATDFLDGVAEHNAAEALFAPFGYVDGHERNAIAHTLVTRPQFAHRLWRSALDGANARYQA